MHRLFLNLNTFPFSFYIPPPPVPLSLSRTFVVSRAESLAGSPGTVAFSVSHPHIYQHAVVLFVLEYNNVTLHALHKPTQGFESYFLLFE